MRNPTYICIGLGVYQFEILFLIDCLRIVVQPVTLFCH
jgi:hypothetical protein